jgi:hypothetical protein
MTYRLADPYTQRVIAEFSSASYRTPRGAYHAATVQAHRHASGGSPVLLSGEGDPVLYLPSGTAPAPALASYEVRAVGPRTRRRRSEGQLELPLEGEPARC